VTAVEQWNWTTVGADFDRDDVIAAVESLDWLPFVDGMDAPACPGLAITTLIREFRIPKVSAVAWRGQLVHGRYSLYGIEGNYKNGRVRIYVVDSGAELSPVASHLVVA
jgi:hypothetical protein